MQLIDNTLSPSQLWIAIESGAYGMTFENGIEVEVE